uniref:Uncharacterized protein n=1 Tax=Salix viminalis TaxID=40686 RepID=A0A6N2MHS9_SALVM
MIRLKHIQLAWDDGLRMPYLEVDSLVLVMVLPERQCHATVSLPNKPSFIKANIKTNPLPKITDSSWSLSFTISRVSFTRDTLLNFQKNTNACSNKLRKVHRRLSQPFILLKSALLVLSTVEDITSTSMMD